MAILKQIDLYVAFKGNSDTMYTYFKGRVILQISEIKGKLFLQLQILLTMDLKKRIVSLY